MYPSANTAIDPKVKRYIILGAIALVVIIIVWVLVNYLTTSPITIQTNDTNNGISIQETSPKYKAIQVGKGKKVYTINLHGGRYVITAKNGYASAQEVLNLGRMGHKKTVTVNVDNKANQEGALEVVSDLGAYSVIANADTVRFIDRNQNPTKLYQIDSNNQLTPLAPGVSFDKISWADITFGVGSAGGKLKAIDGTTVTDLSTPVTAQTYTVAPNKDVYVSDGSNLYRGSNGMNFKKVYTADSGKQIQIISASNDTVLLAGKPSDSTREGELIAFHKDGSKQEIDGEAYEGVWSSSGKYVAVTGSTSTIFNNKLQKVVDLPIANVAALSWIDNDTITYADANLVWQFSVSTRQATVLATTSEGAGTVSELAPSSDGSSLYVVIQNANSINGYSFYLTRYRFNKPANADPLLQKVSLALPNTPVYGCSVGYVNFTKLSVTVRAAAADQQSCTAAARDYLQSYNINPNAVALEFVPQ